MLKRLTLITVLACSAGAHAGMISDYSLTGNVVKNSATGQEWLQWTETRGLSFAQAEAKYADKGWRIANLDEVTALYTDFITHSYEYQSDKINQGSYGDGIDGEKQLGNLFGWTFYNDSVFVPNGTVNEKEGVFLTEAFFKGKKYIAGSLQARAELLWNKGGEYSYVGDGVYQGHLGYPTGGIAMIRDGAIPEKVSEPSTLALMGLGLAGLAAARKRSKK